MPAKIWFPRGARAWARDPRLKECAVDAKVSTLPSVGLNAALGSSEACLR